MNLVQIIKYPEFLRRGAGKFVRQLGEGFSIVLNEKKTENTFAIIRARVLSDILCRAGLYSEKEQVDAILAEVKEKTTERYKRTRSMRTNYPNKINKDINEGN